MKRLLTWTLMAATLGAAQAGMAEPTKTEAKLDDTDKKTTAVAESPAGAEIGQPAPDFVLSDIEGEQHRLSDYTDRIVVLEWFNPDCPFVKKHHKNNKTMQSTFAGVPEEKVVWLAINSGAPGKQGHGLERNLKAKGDYGVAYPILIDETGQVGRLYGAKTTPHMFVIQDGVLVYAGAIDDNRSAGTLGETNYVDAALEDCLEGDEVDVPQTKPYGCTVKYGSSSL